MYNILQSKQNLRNRRNSIILYSRIIYSYIKIHTWKLLSRKIMQLATSSFFFVSLNRAILHHNCSSYSISRGYWSTASVFADESDIFVRPRCTSTKMPTLRKNKSVELKAARQTLRLVPHPYIIRARGQSTYRVNSLSLSQKVSNRSRLSLISRGNATVASIV